MPDTGSEATSKSDTIPIAMLGDGGPSSDVERTLDRIADQLNAATGPAMESTSGVVDLIAARRFGTIAVEVVYRYAEPVDADLSASVILSRLATLEAYMGSEFYPMVDGLNIPSTDLISSYFQPDGEHIISIQCSHLIVAEGDWRTFAGVEPGVYGGCSESRSLADGYASGDFVAP